MAPCWRHRFSAGSRRIDFTTSLSRSWREVLKESTGRSFDGRAIFDYFQPLSPWPKPENRGRTATLPPLKETHHRCRTIYCPAGRSCWLPAAPPQVSLPSAPTPLPGSRAGWNSAGTMCRCPGLPLALHGLTIAHLSDIHLYDGLHEAARRSMQLVGEARPDVTVITGDLVERVMQLVELGPFLQGCRGRFATVVTMGNWEHQVGVSPGLLQATCAAAGAAFLYNEAQVVRVGDGSLALVGLDDPRAGIPDPSRALRDVPADAVQLWGFHAPGYADQLLREPYPRPALTLAGHTHGGQIRPPLLPAITPPASGRFVAGWYRDTFAPMYVSRGIGTSGIRARFRCPPEVVLLTLRPPASIP